jgi:proline dehydrogenase
LRHDGRLQDLVTMRPLRSALLWASRNQWLARRLTGWAAASRAVARFMPGETLPEALLAGGRLQEAGLPSVITLLGENVTERQQAHAVVTHYLSALDAIAAAGLDCELSIKPTQLGLDVDYDACLAGLRRLTAAARRHGTMVWIDMESSAYTDATITLFSAMRRDADNVGLCLQANLRRTGRDLAGLLPLAPSIRLVKGAYAEPADRAYTRRRDVDAVYLRLAEQLLRHERERGRLALATHDTGLIERIEASARSIGRSRRDFEVQMLYGIRADAQRELAADGYAVRVLISYGGEWFPWYMRRLAERPANLLFAGRALLAR